MQKELFKPFLVILFFLVLIEETITGFLNHDIRMREHYEFARLLIISQERLFEDEIFSLKEKALFTRVTYLTKSLKRKTNSKFVCVGLESSFNSCDFNIRFCTDGNFSDLATNAQHIHTIWLGKEKAADFYVLIDNDLKIKNILDIESVIRIIVKIVAFIVLFQLVSKLFQANKAANSTVQPRIENSMPDAVPDNTSLTNQKDNTDSRWVNDDSNSNSKTDTSQKGYMSKEDCKSLVSILQNSLQLWHSCTKKDKISLAEESRLWTVSIDKGTLRTVTLDKYLDIQKIPARPRIKSIIQTANYVLNNTKGAPELRALVKKEVSNVRYKKYTC